LNKSNRVSESKSPDGTMAVTDHDATTKVMIMGAILNLAGNGQNILKIPIVNSLIPDSSDNKINCIYFM